MTAWERMSGIVSAASIMAREWLNYEEPHDSGGCLPFLERLSLFASAGFDHEYCPSSSSRSFI